ncbi:MAG TPA: hypothetical protein VGA35_01300 [bacterium]
MMRGACMAGAVLVMALAMVSATAAVEDPHGIGYDGRDWEAMPQAARLAYVAGFLAGATTQQAVERHRANARLSVDAAVSEIIRSHTGTFPFGVNVYASDLQDFYFRTTRSTKVYQAMLDENAKMLRRPSPR